MGARHLLNRLRKLRRTRKPAIILGASSEEYWLYRRLEREAEYEVLFFIDEEPWNHRTIIGNAQLRYPSELAALCENYAVDTVFYCKEDLAAGLPKLPCELVCTDA